MIYAFEDFLLDSTTRQLRREDEIISIEPQVFAVLELLVRRRERIVSKSELVAEIWGGRFVSDSTISSRISALRHAIGDDGKNQRLIQTFPSRGFRFAGAVRQAREERQRARQPDRPLLAVLPFAPVPHRDRMNHELALGLIEDVTTGLSNLGWLSLVARGVSCTYDGWATDINQIRQSLGVHYLLEGSVRTTDEHRLRITARLVDAETGVSLWVRWFALDQKALLETESRIATEIIEAVARRLMQIELERANSEDPENCNPRQWYLRGVGQVYQWNKSGFEHALESFRRAIELNPQFAPAYGMAAYCYVQKKSYGLLNDRSDANTECEFLAQKAAEFAADDPTTLSRAAHAFASVTGNIDGAAILIEQALKLNPASGLSWYVSGWLQLFQGRPRIGMEHLGRAMGLSLPDPLRFKMRAALAYSHFLQGQYDEAGDAAVKAIASQPGYLTAMRIAAASHALAGRREQAQKLMKVVHERDPALRVSNVSHLLPFRREQDLARWTDGLRKAGLPA